MKYALFGLSLLTHDLQNSFCFFFCFFFKHCSPSSVGRPCLGFPNIISASPDNIPVFLPGDSLAFTACTSDRTRRNDIKLKKGET